MNENFVIALLGLSAVLVIAIVCALLLRYSHRGLENELLRMRAENKKATEDFRSGLKNQ